MTPEILQLQRDVAELLAFKEAISSSSTIPFNVDKAFTNRLSKTFSSLPVALDAALQSTPLTTIADPSGGVTQDAQARTTIGTIIDRLQSLGLIA